MKTAAVVAIVILAVLGYGYWHAATHASFFVSLNIEGNTDYAAVAALDARIRFLDSTGRELARGVPDKEYNYVHLVHPSLGDCHEVEKLAATSADARYAWQVCFEQLSRWIAGWIADVDEIAVTSGDCEIEVRPAAIRKSSPDWYLWWVPLPHVGGTPYSDYSLAITINEKDCDAQASILLPCAAFEIPAATLQT